jgi:DNA-binding XRE family transcriptional regulator
MGSTLADLGSNRLHTDRHLSARQIRAARALLGWSRLELADASGVSEGTIKAIENSAVDARLTTMDKLGRAFAAYSIEFVAEDRWTGVVMRDAENDRQAQSARAAAVTRGHTANSQVSEGPNRAIPPDHEDRNDSAGKDRFPWLRSLWPGRG